MGGQGPLLSGYGKLMASREYLRLHCGGGAAVIFRDFLDREAAHILKALEEGGRIDCSVVFPNQKESIAASIWPSSDAGGMRSFPWSFFAALPDGGRALPAAGYWTGMEELLGVFEEAFGEAETLSDGVSFDETFVRGARRLPLPPPAGESERRHRSRAAALTLREWAEKAFGDVTERFSIALWRLRQVVVRSRERPDRFAGVKLPLAADLDQGVQVDAWLRLLNGSEETLRFAPNIVIAPEPGGGGKTLVVFFRPLRPGILAVLAKPSALRDFVDVTTFQEPASLTGYNEFCSRLRNRLEMDLTMDRFSEIVGDGKQ